MMRLGGLVIAVSVTGLLVAGCSQNKPRVVSSPYSDGVNHSEPVFYNGKHYKMRFRYQSHVNTYAVNVSGKGGRKLGGKPGDQKIVSDMVSSAIGHFACARGQRGRVVPGSQRHSNGAWNMQAKCG